MLSCPSGQADKATCHPAHVVCPATMRQGWGGGQGRRAQQQSMALMQAQMQAVPERQLSEQKKSLSLADLGAEQAEVVPWRAGVPAAAGRAPSTPPCALLYAVRQARAAHQHHCCAPPARPCLRLCRWRGWRWPCQGPRFHAAEPHAQPELS